MKTAKKLLHALLFPPIVLFLLLVPLAAALLIFAFVYDKMPKFLVYASYALSAYTLTVLCTKTPVLIAFFRRLKEENRYLQAFFSDPALRVKVSLYFSLFLNTAYAVLQLGLGFYHASVWFYSLAAYYILLAILRFFLLKDARAMAPGDDLFSEYRRYRFCGVILLAMNLALAVIVFYISWQNRGFSHHFITTIAMAAYTFTSFTLAIVGAVRYRKYQSPMLSAVKAISLAAASVSMLTLETAMLSAFGTESTERFRQIITGLTGSIVCIFVLVIAIFMIVSATRKLNQQRT